VFQNSRDEGIRLLKGHRGLRRWYFFVSVTRIVAGGLGAIRSLRESIVLGLRGPACFRNLAADIGLDHLQHVSQIVPGVWS